MERGGCGTDSIGRTLRVLLALSAFAIADAAAPANADEPTTLDAVTVESGAIDLSTNESANEGHASKEMIDSRTTIRPAEILESVPGLIVTQHSGEGKANQYFLRGYNLDHGTDFAFFVDDVPVNARTHAHGQGYSDLNFLIPELVSGIDYRKGPYYASEGDFAGAGAARIGYLDTLPKGLFSTSIDSFGDVRGLVANSTKMGNGNFLYGLELAHIDGPWQHPDNANKINSVLRYSQGTKDNGFNITGWAYTNRWNSTDQVPQRAIESGRIDRFSSLDPSDGGNSERFALTGKWQRTDADSATKINAYIVRSQMNLWSNFTFFLDDPVNGDQFKQVDKRLMSGVNASHTRLDQWGGHNVENTFGIQVRDDDANVGLFRTANRQILSTTRNDNINELSAGLYYENVFHWNDKVRTIAGLREDAYVGRVHSDLAANSGNTKDNILSPKLGAVFGPWSRTEYYVNWGRGFHSNDLRGTTITVDPTDGVTPQGRVPLLVRVTGTEIGVRTKYIPNLESSFALFQLDQDSELVFSGDGGTTEASRASRRQGFEITNRYAASSWLSLEADFAYTQARFRDNDPTGNRVPGAVEGVGSFGAIVDNLGPYYGGVLLRYFGSRPLIEDNSVRSKPTQLLEARVGYKISDNLRIQLDGFNLLDRKDSNISYFYASRLNGEPGAIDDIHLHPVEPRFFRLTLTAYF